MYNLTNITSANTWYDIGLATNQLSQGLFFIFVMVVLIFSYWAIFKKKDFKEVFLAGSFFGAFLSTLMFLNKWVSSDFLILPYIMFFAGLLMFIFNNE